MAELPPIQMAAYKAIWTFRNSGDMAASVGPGIWGIATAARGQPPRTTTNPRRQCLPVSARRGSYLVVSICLARKVRKAYNYGRISWLGPTDAGLKSGERRRH